MTVLDQLAGGLVVSCQPVDDGPMDRPEIVAAMAEAAVAGGAAGLRIEGIGNLRATRPLVRVPIIGIVKSDLPDSPVRITVTVEQARALIAAGADVVAYDATDRARTDRREDILAAIRDAGIAAMADCATLADARTALADGASLLGTTLSGYTAGTETGDPGPDLGLVRAFRALGGFVMAEGRYDTPGHVAAAMQAGAHSVTVGTALTRLEIMTRRFRDALETAR